ncbi:unnamed protein product [Caenorhabditis bovis]|uniref:Origin recognition complex subunit 1 n=1 Tax=Caenorhabditis bovis TaxID=2654633 RepID=A0A8S1ELF1_9PELO|nr:unnamed protein product [Caenorhabditis bovis]
MNSRLRPRQSTTSKIVTTTPAKSRAERYAGRNKTPRNLGKVVKSVIEYPKEVESSSSSSSDESGSEYNEKDIEIISDDDVSSEMEIDDDDKENRCIASKTRKSAVENHAAKTFANLTLENETRTPRRILRSTPARKNQGALCSSSTSSSINSDSDEIGDDIMECVERAQRSTRRNPLGIIATPNSASRKKTAPIKLKSTKTPGGSKRWQIEKKCEDEKPAAPIRKVVIKLREPLTVAEKLRDLSCRLHLSEVPTELPCREKEAADVRRFIADAIHPLYGESGAMYIGGTTGTGKTATVRTVVESMLKNPKTPKFVYVEVNAMIFRKKIFTEIYNGIQEKYAISSKRNVTSNIAPATARRELNTVLRKADKHRPPIVILVDELDGLVNRKQDILYDIFDWTAVPEARVTVIAISNTLDFPERMLCQRISSRLDKRRLIFHPYDHEQITHIIQSRLSGSDVVDNHAVILAARKVASISGDLRPALDVLRRAIRIALETNAQTLCAEHVLLAQKLSMEPLRSRIIRGLRPHKLMLFRAVLSIMQDGNKEETIFADVYKIYSVICSQLSGLEPISDCEAYEMILQMARSNLFVLSTGNCGNLRRKIKLGMTTHEAETCVKLVEDDHKKTL